MSELMLEQEYALVDVDHLAPHPENPRRGDLEVISGSIRDNGFFGAIIAQRTTGHVLVGNHRLVAAREQGARVLPVLWVDVDDEAALRIMLVENRANDLAGYDDQALAEVLELLAHTDHGFAGTGFSDSIAAEILAAAVVPPQLNDPDDVPDLPDEKSTVTQDGYVWILGNHRLVCGSATDLEVVRTALAGRAAQMVFTDPPYGVAYEGGTADKLTIANDDLAAEHLETELLVPAFGVMAEVLAPGAAFYICSPSGVLEATFRRALERAGLGLRQQLVWIKDRFVLGRSDYHGQHETMLYGWQLGGEPLTPPHFAPEHDTLLYGWKAGDAHTWEGGRKQSTVWEFPRPHRSAVHPTMKPVGLVRRAIENNTRPGGLVLDSFGGSGSTLIACSDANRVAAIVELDPRYVDVICRRYQEHTGVLPVHEATGDAVDFTEV